MRGCGSQDRHRPSPAGHQPYGCCGGFRPSPPGGQNPHLSGARPPSPGAQANGGRQTSWEPGPLLGTLSQTHGQLGSRTGPSGVGHGTSLLPGLPQGTPRPTRAGLSPQGPSNRGRDLGPGLGGRHPLGSGQHQAPTEKPQRAVRDRARLPHPGAQQHPKRTLQERGCRALGLGAGGGTGAAAEARPCWGVGPGRATPCMHRAQWPAQARPSRARTCTLGRQNQDGGSSLLVLSSWNRMRRKKSPVERNKRAPRQADWLEGCTCGAGGRGVSSEQRGPEASRGP